MKLNDSGICVVLAAVLFSVGPSSLHAANFKIKPVVMTGDQAPEGGAFTFIGTPALNNPGAIAFLGGTASSGGIYLASEGMIQRVIKTGDPVIVPELLLSGVLVKKEPSKFFPGAIDYEFSDGHRLSCRPNGNVGFNLGGLLMNDNGNIVFQHGTFPLLFSGGTVTDLFGCPGLIHLLMDLNPDDGSINLTSVTAINNAGTIALKLFTRPFTTPRGLFGERHFLVSGGVPTLFPLVDTEIAGGGTIFTASILAINDSGESLIRFNEAFFSPPKPHGLFIVSGNSRIPVVITGQPAIDGKTFRDVRLGADMNNAGEVFFVAQLSDFRTSVFHWSPDPAPQGTLTLLVREFSDAPGGGFLFGFSNVKINDKGDVAFIANNGIFLLKANGGLSKVVRTGEAAPGGGSFAGFGIPQLNNKGQVAFLGFLSNGKSGIFLASPGLEAEFVDPVPDLLVGSTVSFVPADLATKGRKVTGIAADGAAQVVVRVKTGQTGTVEFSLVDREGQGALSLPASNLNGALGQVGSATLSSTVSVQAQDVTGVGPIAFAAYHAPMDFATSPNSVEAGLPDRKVFIRVRLRTATGETVESTESLKIVRPPVVLVHGLWGSRDSWDRFSPLVNDSKLFVDRIDYSGTNASSIDTNTLQVGSRLRNLIRDYKIENQVAAVQADVVTHSMGGLVIRMLPLFINGLFRDDNFQLGDVHKLINIGTPNFGTRLAQFLLRSPCVSRYFTDKGFPTNQGAIEDLAPNSQALNLINGNPSPLEIHQIVGLASEEDKRSSESSLGFTWLKFFKCPNDFTGIPSGGFFDTVLRTPDHDLIVPASSQRGSATGNATTVGDVVHTRITFFFVGIGELESGAISSRVIQLLNTPLAVPNFQ